MLKCLFAAAAALTLATAPHAAHADDTKLSVIVFPGVQNLPLFAAQAKGFYAKRGLSVEIKFTPGSEELRNGIAEGRYQIAHTAIDNAFAMRDKANVDIAVVAGGDNSFNHLIAQPEIDALADVRGKTVLVDAPNTAYAFQLYEMLKLKGVNRGDYQIKSVGATGFRLEAMLKDKTAVAAILNPPFSIRGLNAGLKDMGAAADALGAYQGTSVFVLRAWGQANSDTLVKYIQANIEGLRWAFDPAHKAEAVALLAERLKLAPDIAQASFEATKSGFARDAALDMDGVRNVLKLRALFEGGAPAAPDKYIDLKYYQKALAGF